jgi:hypothetical protein
MWSQSDLIIRVYGPKGYELQGATNGISVAKI